jgi:hypothetical protein
VGHVVDTDRDGEHQCGVLSGGDLDAVGIAQVAAAIPTATTREIDGAAHAAPFDASATFAVLVAELIATV